MSTWTLIDTETDGLYSPVHIIDIAAQKFDGLSPVGEPFQIFIDHDIEIPNEATRVHGYTTQFISKYGHNPKEAYARFRDFVGADPVVSHSLAFDWDRALVPELIRLEEDAIGSRGFCTCWLSRRALPEHSTHKLDYLRDIYGLACSRQHSALGDVETVVDLLVRIIFPRLRSIGFDSLQSVREFAALKPLLLCKCLIQGLNFDEEAEKVRKAREEKRFLEQLRCSVEIGDYPIPTLILDYDLIEDEPKIHFSGNTFLFTGKLAWGSRTQASQLVEARGGIVSKSKSLTRDIDYLILGEDKEKGWTSLLHGGKLTNAFLRRIENSGVMFKIVREEDFMGALQNR